MKKLILSITVICLFSLTLAVLAYAKDQTNCPVMGGEINKEIYADHDGKRVYFCCSMCIDTFKKDPAKYLKKLADDGVNPAKAEPEKKVEESHEGHDHN